MSGDSFLTVVNDGSLAEATSVLAPCCASRRWLAEMVAPGPYSDLDQMTRVSAEILADLDWVDVREALAAHPRIGDRLDGDGQEAEWSRAEQSSADTVSAGIQADLVQGNIDYETVFDHVFLICATGLPAEAILAALRHRLGNDEQRERSEVRAELRKIVDLRLEKLADA